MTARAALCLAVALAATGCAAPPAIDTGGDRIISIDYCADQMLLGLVSRNRIAAVSVDADNDPVFAAPRAVGLPRVRAEVERIVALRPTLVVRSYGGGPRLAAMLERAGIAVYTLPYSDSIASIRANMLAAGEVLDAKASAQARIATLDAAIAKGPGRRAFTATALYMTPGDVTTGPGGVIADVLRTAGYRPYEARPGWHRLPAERLMGDAPDLVVRAFFESSAYQQDRWSSAGHAALAQKLQRVPTVTIPGAALACGNWLTGDAISAIAGARR